MSSDETAPTGTVVHCRWPGCPSRFTGAPKVMGWRKLSLAPDLVVIVCPFHATGHLPRIVVQQGEFTATCSCHSLLPCMRLDAAQALRDWLAHARDVNGPDEDERVACPDCPRAFPPTVNGTLPRHNAMDLARGRLLAHMCPGVGLPPRGQVVQA